MKLISCHVTEDAWAHEADIVLRVTVGPGECSLIKDELAEAIREQSDLLIQQTAMPLDYHVAHAAANEAEQHVRSGKTVCGYGWQEVPFYEKK